MKIKNVLFYVFLASFITWTLSVIVVCSQIGLLSTSPPVFPRTIDDNAMTIFTISSFLSAASSFLIGLSTLKNLSYAKKHQKE